MVCLGRYSHRLNRSEGKGTGLGMAVLHEAVQTCGGSVEADSAHDKGTAIRIYFRLAGETAT